MNLTQNKLKSILVGENYLTEDQFEMARKEAENQGRHLEEILIERGDIKDEQLGHLIAEDFDIPYIRLEKESIQDVILRIIPEIVAKKQFVIAFARDKEGLKVAMHDPFNLEIINLISKKTGEKVIPYYATINDIKIALGRYHKELKEEFPDLIKKAEIIGQKADADDSIIIHLVDMLLKHAYENKASDIHIEPYENEIRIRFRIDGVLHEVANIPKKLLGLIVTRIKVLSKLRTDEHRAAQDGKLQFKVEGEKIDVRVSIIPIIEGEKVVMRLLSDKGRQFHLEDLGLSEFDLKKVKEAIKKPWGMILATGPTGCGKTTTLYTLLKILNTKEVNISTIEDPIEYDIEGINQIQVNPKTNLTFAAGLKSIVRQDPDIIMVGEIRDEETADIAINSAMTGHLVLSTLHTNDAATTLPRLLDMKIESFLIASTVNVAIGQRLVRKICPKCIESYEMNSNEFKNKIPEEIFKKFFNKEKIRLYRGKGCKLCNQTGYFGRIGIFEVLEMNESIKNLVVNKATSDQIRIQAIKEGLTTMFEDGLTKALNGITTIEEILRVTRE